MQQRHLDAVEVQEHGLCPGEGSGVSTFVAHLDGEVTSVAIFREHILALALEVVNAVVEGLVMRVAK